MNKFDKLFNSIITENDNNQIIKQYRVRKTFDNKKFREWCEKKKLGRGESIYCTFDDGIISIHYYKTRYSQYLGDEDNYSTQQYYNSFAFKNGQYVAKSSGVTGTGYVSYIERQILHWVQEFDPKCKLPIKIDAEIRG